eukprot:gene21531-biopygen2666
MGRADSENTNAICWTAIRMQKKKQGPKFWHKLGGPQPALKESEVPASLQGAGGGPSQPAGWIYLRLLEDWLGPPPRCIAAVPAAPQWRRATPLRLSWKWPGQREPCGVEVALQPKGGILFGGRMLFGGGLCSSQPAALPST